MFDPHKLLTDLRSDGAAARLTASKMLAREACKETTAQRKQWLGYQTINKASLLP